GRGGAQQPPGGGRGPPTYPPRRKTSTAGFVSRSSSAGAGFLRNQPNMEGPPWLLAPCLFANDFVAVCRPAVKTAGEQCSQLLARAYHNRATPFQKVSGRVRSLVLGDKDQRILLHRGHDDHVPRTGHLVDEFRNLLSESPDEECTLRERLLRFEPFRREFDLYAIRKSEDVKAELIRTFERRFVKHPAHGFPFHIGWLAVLEALKEDVEAHA